jgi:hypothetical protein
MNDHTSFRDQLLAVEPPAPDVRHRIEQEIHNMLIHKLSLPGRIFIAVVALFCLATAGLCGYLAATAPAKVPLVARVGLGTGVLFGLAWAIWSVKVLRIGHLNVRRDPRIVAQMVWLFTVLMVVFFLMAGMSSEDRLLGVLLIVQSLAFLIGAGVTFLAYRIEAAELAVKEQLVRTELQITELLERRQA